MSDFQDVFNTINNTKDTTASYSPDDVGRNKGMAILAYFGLLVLIPLLAARDSKFARFHSNQGLILAIVEVLLSAIFVPLGWIPLVGWIFRVIYGLIGIPLLILAILGIINAANGRAKELPIIGGIHLIN